MIKSFDGKSPKIADSAFVSKAAHVIGDVEIGEHSNVLTGAVLRGDFAKITIGCHICIEENCVVHGATDINIGDRVIVGHGAVVHCRRIGNNVLIGNNATVLDDAEIDDFCVVAAGSVVAPGTKIPANSLAMGVPARVRGRVSAEQLTWLEHATAFNAKLGEMYKKHGL